jgi:hypothetical protein
MAGGADIGTHIHKSGGPFRRDREQWQQQQQQRRGSNSSSGSNNSGSNSRCSGIAGHSRVVVHMHTPHTTHHRQSWVPPHPSMRRGRGASHTSHCLHGLRRHLLLLLAAAAPAALESSAADAPCGSSLCGAVLQSLMRQLCLAEVHSLRQPTAVAAHTCTPSRESTGV